MNDTVPATQPPADQPENAVQTSYFRTLTPISKRSRPPENYPIDQLPPRVAETALAICVAADCHPNTAAWAVIGAASAAAQCVAVVETLAGHGSEVPVSLFTHLIAPSGSRKSTAFDAAWRGIDEADDELQKNHAKRKSDIAAAAKGKGNAPATTTAIEARAAGTIKQLITEPSMEALIRDAEVGFPYPALAGAEGAIFYQGYSAGSADRATQTGSILASAYSAERINIPRVGADGKAPNRTLSARQYALGMHFAVQDSSMGYNLLLGNAAEFGMSSRALLGETPERISLIPSTYSDAERTNAVDVIDRWRDHIKGIRKVADPQILVSERGSTPRSVITLDAAARKAILIALEHIEANLIKSSADRPVFERAAEQICRIAATLFVAQDGAPAPGQRVPLPVDYLVRAVAIFQYHWLSRQRLAYETVASDVDSACANIADVAVRWMVDGPGSKGKKAYDPESNTFAWSILLQAGKLTQPRGRYGQDSQFKLAVKQRMIECGIIAEFGPRIGLNPDYIDERAAAA